MSNAALGDGAGPAEAGAAWPPLFEEILRSLLPLIGEQEPVVPDLSLAAYGLDSLSTVSLLMCLEEDFGVVIPDELLVGDNFATPARVWSMVTQLAPPTAT